MMVSTHLMFQGEAAAALKLYASLFPDFSVVSIEHFDDDSATAQIKRADVDFAGQRFIVIDSPISHDFDFTPSTSFFVEFEAEGEMLRAFDSLADGGIVRMPPDDYGFSQKFGWASDRFGVSWQLNLPSTT